jgi:hypothetical protein
MDEPLIGFRAWSMRAGSPKLYGVFHNAHPWTVGVTEAECRLFLERSHPTHFAPDETCTCGLHARTTVDGLLDEYPNYPQSTTGRFVAGPYFEGYKTLILGACLMWGVIIRGEHVIRAQYARPVAFTRLSPRERSIPTWETMAEAVSQENSVPIVPWEQLVMIAGEYGEIVT